MPTESDSEGITAEVAEIAKDKKGRDPDSDPDSDSDSKGITAETAEAAKDSETGDSDSDSDSEPRSKSRSPAAKKRRLVIWLLLAAIVLAFFVPRLIALRGIPLAVNLEFADQLFHLYHVDLLYKRHTLEKSYMDQPYFHQFPDMKDPRLPTRWPPGIYWITFPFAKAFGVYSIWTTQIPNFIATVLTLLGVILLGRVLGGLRLGLWAALLTVLCPALVASSWYYSLDYPLISMICMGLYLLWRTRGFTCWWATLAFGVWSGLAMCIKLSYPMYLVGPSLWAAAVGLRNGPRWKLTLLLPTATGITLTMVAYLLNPEWKEIWNEFMVHAVLRELPAATIDPWTSEWFLCLFKFAINNYPWPLLLLAVPGFVLLHSWRRVVPGRWMFLAYFWGTWICLTGMINKLERYMQPMYPLMCLLTVWSIYQLVPKRWRNRALTVVALTYASMLVYLHYDPTPWHQGQDGARASFHVYYEFLMPGKKRLDALREKTYHTLYDLKPHVNQVLKWAAEDKQRQPLGMVYLKDPKGMILDFPIGEVVVPVVHRLRDRMVLSFLFGMPGIPPSLLNVPLLIVVHPAGLDPEKQHKELRVLKKWTVWLKAGRGSGQYTFSLCKSRLPPLPPLPTDFDRHKPPSEYPREPGAPPAQQGQPGPQGPSGPIGQPPPGPPVPPDQPGKQ